MQEIIVTALDNVGDTRRSDYSAPGDYDGRADLYASYILNTVKPHIDATCRTLTDPANNGALGSSMGGVVSFYSGVRTQRIVPPNGRDEHRVVAHPQLHQLHEEPTTRSNLRIYMDVGNSGSTSGGNNADGYWDSLGVRDNFTGFTPPASSKYALDGIN